MESTVLNIEEEHTLEHCLIRETEENVRKQTINKILTKLRKD